MKKGIEVTSKSQLDSILSVLLCQAELMKMTKTQNLTESNTPELTKSLEHEKQERSKPQLDSILSWLLDVEDVVKE